MMQWLEIPPTPSVIALGGRAFASGSLRAIVSRDGAEKLWHLSISHPTRYPKWDEIKEARYDLLPDEITVGILLPPRAEYVNIHPNCFHLHQICDKCEIHG